MKVRYQKRIDLTFGDLDVGDVFDSDSGLFLKTEPIIAPSYRANCVDLESGAFSWAEDDEEVRWIDYTMFLK